MRLLGLFILLAVTLLPVNAGAQGMKYCDYASGNTVQGTDVFLISRNCAGTYKLSAMSIADYVLSQTPGVNGQIFFRSGGVLATATASDIRAMLALHAVSVSGAYNDLTGRPSLATVASSGQYSDLAGVPILSAVATSGAYSDLSGRPTLGTMAAAATADYYTAVSTDSLLTGKANASHTHAISGVTGLQAALDGKAGAIHSHTISDTTGLQTALDGKVTGNGAVTAATKTKITYDAKGLVTSGADAGISDITGLQSALDAKSATGHSHSGLAPAGGSAGYVLKKSSGVDFDYSWVAESVGGGAVDSVNGQTGTVVLDADDVDDSATAHKFVTGTDITKLSNLSGTNSGDQTSVTGNAGTATSLQTARTINGISFDGTANITVTAAAGTLTGSALASGVTSSSLSSVGTVSTGIWQGTPITDSYISSASTWNGKQAGDATLTALAGVTTAANKLIYATGSDAFTTTDITSAGRALLDDTSAADQLVTLGAAPASLSINTQTSSYSLVLADATRYVRMNLGSANNLTVPLNSSVAFPTGTQIIIRQTGAGQTTIVATGGVTINTAETLKLRAQGSTATLIKVATDEWDLTGDLEIAP